MGRMRRACAGKLSYESIHIAKTWAPYGFHGMNLIITELCWLVMCQ